MMPVTGVSPARSSGFCKRAALALAPEGRQGREGPTHYYKQIRVHVVMNINHFQERIHISDLVDLS